MAITIDEVRALGERWCDTLRTEGGVAERERFFLHDNPRIYVQEQGVSMTLDEHAAYHSQFGKQILTLGDFTVMTLSEDPDRARALGSFYWEGHFKDTTKRPLRCVVGEDWLLERTPSGEVKFVLWLNTMHHFLADSSVKSLDL